MSLSADQRSGPERWLEACLAALFLAALLLNLSNGLLRGVFDISAVWADEAQQFALVWLAFLGAALAVAQNSHLRCDVLRHRLPASAQRFVTGAEGLLLPLVCGLAFYESARYVWQIATLGTRSDMAGIPMWLPHGAVTLGFGLMAVLELMRLPRRLSGDR